MKANLPTNPEPAGRPVAKAFSAIMTLSPDTRLRLVDDEKEVFASPAIRKWNEQPTGASIKIQTYILVCILFSLAVCVWYLFRHVRF